MIELGTKIGLVISVIISFVVPNQIWYMRLSINPYLHSIFLGLTSGILLL